MTAFSSDLKTRQLEWARDDAARARQQLYEARRDLFRLRDVVRHAALVVAGLDEDGHRCVGCAGYDSFAQTVDELRQALGRVEE